MTRALKTSLRDTRNPKLDDIARELRGKIVELSFRGQAPHLGSALSCADILVAVYWGGLDINPQTPDDPNRDRLILSKGHAAQALYSALAMRGYFSETLLDTYNQDGGRLAEHPGPHCAPGVEAATGSLGHGLPIASGMAIAGRIQGRPYKTVAVLSDGECNEGSVWESALVASAQRLDRLCVVVDFNRWQATGRSTEVTGLAPLVEKWLAFGWSARNIDGHDVYALRDAIKGVPDGTGKPVALIAHTVKGKGVSFMEDDNNWHYRIPTEEEVAAAHRELGLI